jgi:hypothetical protein
MVCGITGLANRSSAAITASSQIGTPLSDSPTQSPGPCPLPAGPPPPRAIRHPEGPGGPLEPSLVAGRRPDPTSYHSAVCVPLCLSARKEIYVVRDDCLLNSFADQRTTQNTTDPVRTTAGPADQRTSGPADQYEHVPADQTSRRSRADQGQSPACPGPPAAPSCGPPIRMVARTRRSVKGQRTTGPDGGPRSTGPLTSSRSADQRTTAPADHGVRSGRSTRTARPPAGSRTSTRPTDMGCGPRSRTASPASACRAVPRRDH